MKKLLISMFLLTLAACSVAPQKQFYRAAGDSDQLSISGEFRPLDGLNGSVDVIINNDVVSTGKIPLSVDFEFSGTYENKTVDAVCHKKSNGGLVYTINCLILINNERAATLVFN
jgi:hypothetical protein